MHNLLTKPGSIVINWSTLTDWNIYHIYPHLYILVTIRAPPRKNRRDIDDNQLAFIIRRIILCRYLSRSTAKSTTLRNLLGNMYTCTQTHTHVFSKYNNLLHERDISSYARARHYTACVSFPNKVRNFQWNRPRQSLRAPRNRAARVLRCEKCRAR